MKQSWTRRRTSIVGPAPVQIGIAIQHACICIRRSEECRSVWTDMCYRLFSKSRCPTVTIPRIMFEESSQPPRLERDWLPQTALSILFLSTALTKLGKSQYYSIRLAIDLSSLTPPMITNIFLILSETFCDNEPCERAIWTSFRIVLATAFFWGYLIFI